MKVTQGTRKTEEGKKTGVPPSRAGLRSTWAGFQVTHIFPSPGGEFAAKRPLALLQGDPWVSVSSLVTGLDTE